MGYDDRQDQKLQIRAKNVTKEIHVYTVKLYPKDHPLYEQIKSFIDGDGKTNV